jgi:hypothetical protein
MVNNLGAVPQDIDAETAVLGDMLALDDIVGPVSATLRAEDFHNPMCGEAFAAIVAAHAKGQSHDVTSLRDVLRTKGWDPEPRWFHDLVSSGSGAWRRHAETVTAMAARRSILAAIGEATADTRAPGLDPFGVIDTLKGRLAAITRPVSEASADLWKLDDFMDHTDHVDAPWIVPGLLKRGWRVVVVAAEGVGKSMLWRQVAILAAQGIHPLAFYTFEPVRTLLIDLENPADAITKSCRSIRDSCNADMYERGRAWIWHRPAGIDLRSRATRAELEANIAACRPDLVCLGPLYKAYSRSSNETDEDATREVQETLDDLRTRYGFALLLEHHAPQDQGGHRVMRPYGSSLWLRWPEIGIGMERLYPDTDQRDVKLKRWRGDRLQNDWPKELLPGLQWPWVAPT